MTDEPIPDRTAILRQHLQDNESECIKHNITVQVGSTNASNSVAFCTVEQRISGLLRRDLNVPELVWRAEQALAPLIGLGTVPLITVRHKSLNNLRPSTPSPPRSFMDHIPDLWRWLGSPFAREGFGAVVLVRDPFGWRRAMTNTRRS